MNHLSQIKQNKRKWIIGKMITILRQNKEEAQELSDDIIFKLQGSN